VPIEANTLYPLLRRMESQGLLKSSWNTDGPKPRNYYVTTDLGEQVLAELSRHWRSMTRGVNQLLEGRES
jgi:DNA-binding PadR family transcriptional regulator